MKTHITKSVFLLILIVSVLPFAVAHGQEAIPSNEAIISVTVSPENPQPNQTATFTVSSYSSNLDVASISWYVNGRQISRGTGMKTFSTQIGAIGTKTSVKVVV